MGLIKMELIKHAHGNEDMLINTSGLSPDRHLIVKVAPVASRIVIPQKKFRSVDIFLAGSIQHFHLDPTDEELWAMCEIYKHMLQSLIYAASVSMRSAGEGDKLIRINQDIAHMIIGESKDIDEIFINSMESLYWMEGARSFHFRAQREQQDSKRMLSDLHGAAFVGIIDVANAEAVRERIQAHNEKIVTFKNMLISDEGWKDSKNNTILPQTFFVRSVLASKIYFRFQQIFPQE